MSRDIKLLDYRILVSRKHVVLKDWRVEHGEATSFFRHFVSDFPLWNFFLDLFLISQLKVSEKNVGKSILKHTGVKLDRFLLEHFIVPLFPRDSPDHFSNFYFGKMDSSKLG